MGHHADGIVFYGYDLGDLGVWVYDEESRAPSWLIDEDGEETGAWWENVLTERAGKPAEECDFDLGCYGHCDAETYWFAAIRSTVVNATYECKPITPGTTDPAWTATLHEFMRLLELPIPDGPPQWHVTSTYG